MAFHLPNAYRPTNAVGALPIDGYINFINVKLRIYIEITIQ